MKTALAIIALLSALSTTPMLAANHDKAPASVEARLVQADLSVTLQQYEKVKRLTGKLRCKPRFSTVLTPSKARPSPSESVYSASTPTNSAARRSDTKPKSG